MREMGRWGDGELGRWGDEFFSSASSAPCPMPNAQFKK